MVLGPARRARGRARLRRRSPLGALLGLIAGLVLLAAPALPAAAEPAIAADVRLDLVGLLQRLSGDPASPRNPVSDAAVVRFSRWREHPAVARLARMRAKGFAWDAPAQYAVYLSSPPELAEAFPAPDFFASLAGGKDQLDAWRRELGDFVRVSGFEDWEHDRVVEREAELGSVRAAAAGRDLGAPLEKFLGGRPWASWTVIVSPFFPHGGGASWVLEEKAGRPDVLVVYGPKWSPKSFWRRARPVPDTPEEFAASAWPEAVFSMTYALYEVCRPALKAAPDVCRGLEGLTQPEDCVQQTLVRGAVARLIASEFGPAAAKGYREHWPATPYQEKADAALAAYESDRAKAPDLMAAAGLLFAPFQADGAEPACRLIDHGRDKETVYSRRLKYYLEGRK